MYIWNSYKMGTKDLTDIYIYIYIYIYMLKPKDRRPKSAGIYISWITSAHVITNIITSDTLKIYPNLKEIPQLVNKVTDADFDGRRLF